MKDGKIESEAELKEIAASEGSTIVEGVLTNSFNSRKQQKKHKQLKSQVKHEVVPRTETEVISTGIFLKTSVAGNSVVGTIGDMRITIPHKEIAAYYEGLTNSLEVLQIVPKELVGVI